MATKIDINGLANAIAKECAKYTAEIAEGIKAAADETAKELLTNTRADAPVSQGKYKRAMAIKTVHESQYEKRVKWYVKAPHYRKSHLLEKGHAKRNGGRVRGYPHIAGNAENAIQSFEERTKEVIENGGK